MPKSPSQPHPYDSPTHEHPQPVPLVSPSDLVNPMLTIADAMNTDLRTCSPASSVLEAVLIFRDAETGIVPVMEDGKPVGVLTDRDVALALAEHQQELPNLPVRDLMTTDVTTIDASAPLEKALEVFSEAGVRRLLVVDRQGGLAGVLSWIDLLPHVSERGAGYVISRIIQKRKERQGESAED